MSLTVDIIVWYKWGGWRELYWTAGWLLLHSLCILGYRLSPWWGDSTKDAQTMFVIFYSWNFCHFWIITHLCKVFSPHQSSSILVQCEPLKKCWNVLPLPYSFRASFRCKYAALCSTFLYVGEIGGVVLLEGESVNVCEFLPFFIPVPFKFRCGHSGGFTLQCPHTADLSLWVLGFLYCWRVCRVTQGGQNWNIQINGHFY